VTSVAGGIALCYPVSRIPDAWAAQPNIGETLLLPSNGALSIPACRIMRQETEQCEPVSHEARISEDCWRKLTGCRSTA
jgi:hypothetical protein